jgi:hypothetical protein
VHNFLLEFFESKSALLKKSNIQYKNIDRSVTNYLDAKSIGFLWACKGLENSPNFYQNTKTFLRPRSLGVQKYHKMHTYVENLKNTARLVQVSIDVIFNITYALVTVQSWYAQSNIISEIQ